MASVHPQDNKRGRTWRVKWRQDGKPRSLSFDTKAAAERFRDDVDQYGPEEAERVLEVLLSEATVPAVAQYLETFIDGLTGVQPATMNKYRRYLARDIAPVFGSLPITAVTEHTIGTWVAEMAAPREVTRKNPDGTTRTETVRASRKTLQNKHAFLSGALKQAVKDQLITVNPCDGRRLPETMAAEHVYLTPDEFHQIRSFVPAQYRGFVTFLILTGLRFSEATALTAADVNVHAKTARVWRAWKYATRRGDLELGPPKTKRGKRTVSLPDAALSVLDLTQPEWLFTNGVGSPIRAQEFFNLAWKPARDKAKAAGLAKTPRVHDLRHSCASWLIQAGVPLPVIQQQLGHESITTTVNTYGHLDRRSADLAAMVLDQAITTGTVTIDAPLSIE